MKKTTTFDKLIFALILAFLFSLGLHIGSYAEEEAESEIVLTVKPSRFWGEPFESAALMIDGKYPVSIIGYDNGLIKLSASGRLYPAGYLISGAKYISPNQPVRIYTESSGFEGKIHSVENSSVNR